MCNIRSYLFVDNAWNLYANNLYIYISHIIIYYNYSMISVDSCSLRVWDWMDVGIFLEKTWICSPQTVHGGDDPITDDLQSPVPPPRTSTSEQEGQGHGPNKPKMVGWIEHPKKTTVVDNKKQHKEYQIYNFIPKKNCKQWTRIMAGWKIKPSSW